jgi:hypothetical protein
VSSKSPTVDSKEYAELLAIYREQIKKDSSAIVKLEKSSDNFIKRKRFYNIFEKAV